jgi:hypothetical protein
MSKNIPLSDYLHAFAQLMQSYYAPVKAELYPDNSAECIFKGAIEKPVRDYATERFGFLMITGRIAEIIEGYASEIDPATEHENPETTALAFLNHVIENFQESVLDPENVQYISDEAHKQLGFLNQVALGQGCDLAFKNMQARLTDYLQMVPLTAPDVTPEPNIPTHQPPFRYRLN